MNKYLDATRNYAAFDEDGDDDGENYCGSYSSCSSDEGMEEEKPTKNQPDEDGWIVA